MMPPKKQASRGSTSNSSSTSVTRQYLILYNLASSLMWGALLFRTLNTLLQGGLSQIFPTVGTFARNVQTIAIAEILHSVLGLVRAALFTTFMQVASRIVVIWGVVDTFAPGLGLGARNGSWNNQLAYTGMLSAWSITEIVRYGYFVAFLWQGANAAAVPGWLTWARYNLFFVLYPVGIGCEVWLVYHAVPMAETLHVYYAWFLRVSLAIYVPGSYVLFTHMMAQRRRVMRGKQKAASG